jgi:hypothetical protein
MQQLVQSLVQIPCTTELRPPQFATCKLQLPHPSLCDFNGSPNPFNGRGGSKPGYYCILCCEDDWMDGWTESV